MRIFERANPQVLRVPLFDENEVSIVHQKSIDEFEALRKKAMENDVDFVPPQRVRESEASDIIFAKLK